MDGLDLLHVDNHVLVVHKPTGVPIVPDESGDESLLGVAKAWVAREFDKPGRVFLGVVHRLDRPVSGVVVLARTSKAAARLTRAFRDREVDKVYHGVCARPLATKEGELVQWLRKDTTRNTVHAYSRETVGAKRARTEWRVLRETGTGDARRVLVELRPETGRPHQLRVAMATLGAPLLGDLRYGAAHPLPDRSIALHAASLEFPHPTLRERMRFSAPPPALGVWRF